MLSRKEEHLATGNRPNSVQKVKIGTDREGNLQAIEVMQHGSGGIGGGCGQRGPFAEVYRCANYRGEERNVYDEHRAVLADARAGMAAGQLRAGTRDGRDGAQVEDRPAGISAPQQ